MQQRFDKTGRRIPQFDRVAAGKRSAERIMQNDPDFYKRIGSVGGSRSTNGGFHTLAVTDPERFKAVSAQGGRISRRRPRTSLTSPASNTENNLPRHKDKGTPTENNRSLPRRVTV